MQHKSLDISQPLLDFKGEPIKDGEENMTLKTALLVYIMNAHRMNLQGKEENARAYEAGQIIGGKEGKVQLTQHQLDVVKKLAEHNRIDLGQNQTAPVYGLVVSQQVLDMLNAAETVK